METRDCIDVPLPLTHAGLEGRKTRIAPRWIAPLPIPSDEVLRLRPLDPWRGRSRTHSAIPRRDARRHHQTRDYLSARDDHPACVMWKDICCPLPATPLGERDARPFLPSFTLSLSFSRSRCLSLFLSCTYRGSLRSHHARVIYRVARGKAAWRQCRWIVPLSRVQRYHDGTTMFRYAW